MSPLLGPPELYSNSNASAQEKMDSDEPEKGFTENGSATYRSSGNPCLDFFFQILPDTRKKSLIRRLELAWTHNPLTALKLICHLRGVRGTGKSDKRGFYIAAQWFHQNHPKTLAFNVRWFAQFGYFKDLLEILYRLVHGFDVHVTDKIEREACPVYWKKGKRKERTRPTMIWLKGKRQTVERSVLKKPLKPYPKRQKTSENLYVGKTGKSRKKYSSYSDTSTTSSSSDSSDYSSSSSSDSEVEVRRRKQKKTRSEIIPKQKDRNKMPKKESRKIVPKKKNKIEMAKKAVEKYNTDPNYRFLHDQVSDLFAELLSLDIKYLESKEYNKISLASKWCPSLDSSYDQSILICESIAKRIFPRDCDSAYQGIEEAHYAYRVRDRLRKQVLVPLRQALQLPEIYMSAKKWDSLPYDRVASVAMKLYKHIFVEHDTERFTTHIENVKEGKAKMAAGALLPHEILDSLDEAKGDKQQVKDVAELQWKRMVEDLSAKGKLTNCLAICDVSGSMSGLPMKVCVALGILIAELSEDPWKGKLITFSKHPTLQILQGDTLEEKKSFVEHMDWGMNTDFQKVFDLILGIAVKGKLNESKMIKRVFVFSDMEFDQASSHDWETDYEAIQRRFKRKGYGSAVPEIVFWNLRDSNSTPVTAKQKGVALVSGYSKNLLKLFLEDTGVMDPMFIMESAIAGAEYDNLKVYD